MSNILQFPVVPKINRYTSIFHKLEILFSALKFIPLSPQQKSQIFHQQLLNSSLFSAKIEGNTLDLHSLGSNLPKNTKSKNKLEITNVLQALSLIPTINKPFSLSKLISIHQVVMKNLSSQAGQLRGESSAIYDQFGNIVYLTPDPKAVKSMLKIFILKINKSFNSDWEKQLLEIGCCHYYFEKIHPFLDGNGRTGRVILHYQLLSNPVSQGIFLPIEQYFEENKNQYYYFLEKNTRHLEIWLEFFMKGLVWSLEKSLQDYKNLPSSNSDQQSLLPRRQEILNIITDHPYISLDSLARRFPTIPKRTISHDVNQLIKAKLITKYGKTKGVVYTSVK